MAMPVGFVKCECGRSLLLRAEKMLDVAADTVQSVNSVVDAPGMVEPPVVVEPEGVAPVVAAAPERKRLAEGSADATGFVPKQATCGNCAKLYVKRQSNYQYCSMACVRAAKAWYNMAREEGVVPKTKLGTGGYVALQPEVHQEVKDMLENLE